MVWLALLQEGGCDSFILDLRNNPGGLVRAGLDIARLWLPGDTAILTVEGRDSFGNSAMLQVALPCPDDLCLACRLLPCMHLLHWLRCRCNFRA